MSLLHVHEWRNDYVIAHDHPDPQRARDALDRAAELLPSELHNVASRFATGDEVVLIERLDFQCEVDLSCERELVAARWAHGFAHALSEALDSGDGVVRFPSAAAYRARFIADLAGGSAAGAWYYKPFAGLEALPAAAAIRTLLLEDPELGRETLIALPDRAWPALAAILTRRETERIVAGLAPDDGDPSIAALAALLPKITKAERAGLPGFVCSLVALRAGLSAGLAPTRSLATFAMLAGVLSKLAESASIDVRQALLDEDIATLASADPDANVEIWNALACRAEWRRALAEPLAAPTTRAADARSTGYAGLVLLLPELGDLLDDTLPAALPHTALAPRNLAAWIALAHCAGADRAARFLRDSFWRDFFAIPPHFGSSDLAAWIQGADAHPALAALAERARARARGDPVDALLSVGGNRRCVQVDQATGIWCDWRSVDAEATVTWRARLAATRSARRDWAYLDVALSVPEQWQRFFAQLAQIALRRLAYRLPGFARTSLPYIYVNFLDAAGRTDGGADLRLTRPPLYTLLNLTGVGRARVRWPGPPERTLVSEYLP